MGGGEAYAKARRESMGYSRGGKVKDNWARGSRWEDTNEVDGIYTTLRSLDFILREMSLKSLKG